MKKYFPIHPVLFALFPILALYANNMRELAPSQLITPLASVIGFAAVFMLAAWALLRNIQKAGIITAIFFILFFSYGHVINAISGSHGDKLLLPYHRVLWPIWCVIFIFVSYFTLKTRRSLNNLTVVMNVIAVVLFVIPAVNIAVHETKATLSNSETAQNTEINIKGDLGTEVQLPDIYYIIMDRYASADTLKERYNFDNSEFMDYLINRGFYVASKSTSNYMNTQLSLASSLNMNYINALCKVCGHGFTDWDPIYKMLQDYEVWHFLKDQGYEFIHFGSWWGPTMANKYADKNFNHSQLQEFPMLILQTTMAYPACVALHILDMRVTQYERIMDQFDELAEIPKDEKPTFVFAHLLIPHEPYVFDSDGNYLTAEQASARSSVENYVNQLAFANNKLMSLIDSILQSSETPPIIILQADEGPLPKGGGWSSWKGIKASEAELKEKFGILNAYYLPNVDTTALYSYITPVNSFRVVFNLYFGTSLELLPDINYAIFTGPYDFVDVTNRIRND